VSRLDALEKRVSPVVGGTVVQAPTPGRRSDIFVPSKIYVRGWSDYGSDAGVPKHEVPPLVEALLNSDVMRPHVDKIRGYFAPGLLARQIILNLDPDKCVSRQDIWSLRDAVVEHFSNKVILGKPIRVSIEQPQWKQERNKVLLRAKDVWEKLCPHARVTLDWDLAALWTENPVLQIGKVSQGSFEWSRVGVPTVGRDVTVEALRAASL